MSKKLIWLPLSPLYLCLCDLSVPPLSMDLSSFSLGRLLPTNLEERHRKLWPIELSQWPIIALPLDNTKFSIHHQISCHTSSDNITCASKQCFSSVTLVFADFKDRYGKGARRTAIVVDEGQFISKVICLKMISDWFRRSWHYKMACSFRKGRDTIMLRTSFYHRELNWMRNQNGFLQVHYKPKIR